MISVIALLFSREHNTVLDVASLLETQVWGDFGLDFDEQDD